MILEDLIRHKKRFRRRRRSGSLENSIKNCNTSLNDYFEEGQWAEKWLTTEEMDEVYIFHRHKRAFENLGKEIELRLKKIHKDHC